MRPEDLFNTYRQEDVTNVLVGVLMILVKKFKITERQLTKAIKEYKVLKYGK